MSAAIFIVSAGLIYGLAATFLSVLVAIGMRNPESERQKLVTAVLLMPIHVARSAVIAWSIVPLFIR
jgi:hypothetical protein